ncbi:MAG: hypothetical protein A4E57_04900 [Syntrophorhabdaceae bacterium PtaU1.Bin034]|nr:MAG: hypothetical protein A4E57_04900 [Syntrophorhabdaceae bacterium PtaU1.Bin034]
MAVDTDSPWTEMLGDKVVGRKLLAGSIARGGIYGVDPVHKLGRDLKTRNGRTLVPEVSERPKGVKGPIVVPDINEVVLVVRACRCDHVYSGNMVKRLARMPGDSHAHLNVPKPCFRLGSDVCRSRRQTDMLVNHRNNDMPQQVAAQEPYLRYIDVTKSIRNRLELEVGLPQPRNRLLTAGVIPQLIRIVKQEIIQKYLGSAGRQGSGHKIFVPSRIRCRASFGGKTAG